MKSAICEHDIYMTQSYACGSVFTVSVLDFLASAVSSLNIVDAGVRYLKVGLIRR